MVHEASFAGILGIVDPTYPGLSDLQVADDNIEKHSEDYGKEERNKLPMSRNIVVGGCGSSVSIRNASGRNPPACMFPSVMKNILSHRLDQVYHVRPLARGHMDEYDSSFAC